MGKTWRLIALSSLLFGGCAHSGRGTGTLEAPGTAGTEKSEGPIAFSWTSGADASSGTIQATARDGRVFTGTFIQITSSQWVNTYNPYWNTWTSPVWGTPRPRWGGSQQMFVTNYSGKIMAHLTSPDGTRMRCEFVLVDPISGMNGGGEGDCDLSTHETVFDAVLDKGHRGTDKPAP